MKHQKVILERIILESSDFSKIGLITYVKLSPEYVILQGHKKRYICKRRGLHEYEVLGVYLHEDNHNRELVRNKGYTSPIPPSEVNKPLEVGCDRDLASAPNTSILERMRLAGI